MGDPSALHSLRRFGANHRKDFIEGSRVWTQPDLRLLCLMPIGVYTMGVDLHRITNPELYQGLLLERGRVSSALLEVDGRPIGLFTIL
jgi:hypothetical protein